MVQLYEKHAQDAQQCLEKLFSASHDSSFAGKAVANYYSNGGKWLWMDNHRQLDKCSAADSMLNKELKEMGFSPATFNLADIDSALAVMQKPDSAENVAQVMANAEFFLTNACLKYAIGQRFGFTKPSLLFGKQSYDIDNEEPDSTFLANAFEQLAEPHAMKEFLRSVESADSAYHRLKARLATDSTTADRLLTLCNMERLRWRDKKHPEQACRRIFVNIAAQQVWGIGPDSIINMRICCGKPSTKTPLLSSEIHLIQVNPEWGIPQSIIRGEVSGHAGDSAYFARRNYYVTNSSGQHVNPSSLSSADLRSGRYAVRQRSGPGNSLGRIIFRFANRFSVYLHDTSTPSAFNKERRTVSHGCVRLQRPFDMAEFVLPEADDWKLDQMRLSMDLKPKTDRGKEYRRTHTGAIRLVNSVNVEPKVPVVINYFTLYPNPKTGETQKWPDLYSYDNIIAKAIKPFLP